MKKKDLPYLPFYIGDWKKDPAVQTLSLEQKMIWLELIFLMWESEERGYLTINKKPITEETLAFMLNLDKQKLEICLRSFESLNLFSRRESDGAIFSRKILNIISLSEIRSKAGSLGGNPILAKAKLKQFAYPNADIETDIDIEDETKNTNKKKKLFDPVEFFKAEYQKGGVLKGENIVGLYKSFVDMRKRKGKPVKTEYGVSGHIAKLEKSTDPEKMLKHSTDSEYQGLFDPPENAKPKQTEGTGRKAEIL